LLIGGGGKSQENLSGREGTPLLPSGVREILNSRLRIFERKLEGDHEREALEEGRGKKVIL